MDPMYMSLPNLEPEELNFIQNVTKDMSEDDKKKFFMFYSNRRRDPQMMLLLTLVGFIGVAGIHRMMMGELGLGIIYLFTGGLCLIGTIVDIFNYKKLANEYNQRIAMECTSMLKMM